jgi:hypothetical protein
VATEFADAPIATAVVPANSSSEKVHQVEKAAGAGRSDHWITIGVITLIVSGMLLGAAITRLWIGHFAQGPLTPWP